MGRGSSEGWGPRLMADHADKPQMSAVGASALSLPIPIRLLSNGSAIFRAYFSCRHARLDNEP